jgi:hypothetical protein
MPKGRLKHMRPRVRDLFGDVPVYTYEVEAWLLAVSRMPIDSPRAAWYIRAYDVVGKIKACKLAGTLQDVLQAAPGRVGYWWERFSWARPSASLSF